MIRIYVLIDPFTLQVRYVGRTSKKLRVRMQVHLGKTDNSNGEKEYWIRSLDKQGRIPHIKEVDLVEKSDAKDAEIRWIRHYESLGCYLLNINGA